MSETDMSRNELVGVEVVPLGAGFLDHNLRCWLCKNNKAFYVGNPRWVFAPCWECQTRYRINAPDAWWPVVEDLRNQRRRWWQFWKGERS